MAGSTAGALYVGPGWDGAHTWRRASTYGARSARPGRQRREPRREGQEFSRESAHAWETTVRSSNTATADQIEARGRHVAGPVRPRPRPRDRRDRRRVCNGAWWSAPLNADVTLSSGQAMLLTDTEIRALRQRAVRADPGSLRPCLHPLRDRLRGGRGATRRLRPPARRRSGPGPAACCTTSASTRCYSATGQPTSATTSATGYWATTCCVSSDTPRRCAGSVPPHRRRIQPRRRRPAKLPLPVDDYLADTDEERLVMYADASTARPPRRSS